MTRAPSSKKKVRASRTPPAKKSVDTRVEHVSADKSATPFESFVIDFICAQGGTVESVGPHEYQAVFDPGLAKQLHRRGARLIFDLDRATLPRGGVFVAAGSRFGLALLQAARGGGHVARSRLSVQPDADAQEIAGRGYVLHGVEAHSPTIGEMRWVCQVIYHLTLTLRGGVAEQDVRTVLADPRGPIFEFLGSEDRKRWQLLPGFPEGPVWWGDDDISENMSRKEAAALWPSLLEWINRVQENRLARWRKRCKEARDTDLARVNDYYQTRLSEEGDRRRRRRDEPDEEELSGENQIKLEWSRRVRSIRGRWEPQAELRLWGIEEVARPRVPVTWELETPEGTSQLVSEVDLAEAVLIRHPCPVCGRLAGEFWWEGQLVCRRCRRRKSHPEGGRASRSKATPAAQRVGGGLRTPEVKA